MFVYDEFIKPILKGLNLEESLEDALGPKSVSSSLIRIDFALLEIQDRFIALASNKEKALSFLEKLREEAEKAGRGLIDNLPHLTLRDESIKAKWIELGGSLIRTHLDQLDRSIKGVISTADNMLSHALSYGIVFRLCRIANVVNQIEGKIDC